jgi:hypothetical protein
MANEGDETANGDGTSSGHCRGTNTIWNVVATYLRTKLAVAQYWLLIHDAAGTKPQAVATLDRFLTIEKDNSNQSSPLDF